MDLKLKGLDEFIEKRMTELNVPGLGIGIVKEGSTALAQGFGFADLENKVKMTPDHVLRFASISKTFTGIALMQLWELGKFKLDDNINDYLPNGGIYPKNKSAPPITFKHLLTHTSGIGEILKKSDLVKIPHFVTKNKEKLYTLEKLFNRNIFLKTEPGKKWSYANFGFNLLGYLLQIISGVEFSTYMKENILDLLDMNATDFAWSERVRPYQAKGYIYKKGKFKETGTSLQVHMPAGSIYASINDMLSYMKCLLQGGKFDAGQILKQETLKSMWSTQFHLDDRLVAIGYVFWKNQVGDYEIFDHGGSISGYLSWMYLIPKEKLGIIIGINQNSIRDMSAITIAHEILHRLLKLGDIKVYLEGITPSVNLSLLRKFKGRYGPPPPKDLLTNTRFYMLGGEIKIKIKKNTLIYKTMWGPKKKGVKLWQADQQDPYYYKIINNISYNTVTPYESVVFQKDSKGNIISFYKGFNEYIKKKWYKTFKFKIYSRMIFTLLLVIILIIFL